MSQTSRWTRGRGGSPASLQQRLPFANEEALEDDASSVSPNPSSTPGRSIPSRQWNQRAPSSQHLSSSVGHRIPTRSFAHSTFGSVEPVHYSSHGVRDQTQLLASWGLEQPPSTPRSSATNGATLAVDTGRAASPRRRTGSVRSDDEPIGRRSSRASSQPEAIQEVLEVQEELQHTSSREGREVAQGDDISEVMHIPPGELPEPPSATQQRSADIMSFCSPVQTRRSREEEEPEPVPDERTLLLPKHRRRSGSWMPPFKDVGDAERQLTGVRGFMQRTISYAEGAWRAASHPKTWRPSNVGRATVAGSMAVLQSLPAVFLGWLLNVLDALSYGTILFPLGEPMFADTGPDGIAIFFVSTIISQVVYSCFSKFKGGVGSEMIEVVPFFHKMAYLIMAHMGSDAPTQSVMATVYVSYIISAIVTGIIFLLLGAFRLGNLVNFFPRSILTGCIGGVGVFLFITGIEVSAGISGNLEYNLDTLQRLLHPQTLPLWTIPLLLAIVLFVIKLFSERPIIVPAYFISIFAVFYIVVAAMPHHSLENLRESGWIFEKPQSGVEFYHFYSYYNLKIVNWGAIAQCLPTMLALSFFGIIHVPINVPALALAVQEDDISTNKELINHGISNTVSGFAGSIQNYLVYANSSMFIRNGGNSRLAGFLLALATLATWMAGPESIGYIPKMIVGTLIYLLGVDLIKEAIWDTFGRINKLEYLMILVIVLVMGFHDFVVGIGIGILISSLIFVVQTSRVSAVRAVFSGSIAESTVRRHPVHRRFLHDVGSQLRVFKLAGYLFFGTIVDVEKKIRHLLQDEEFSRQPIRFLVLDFLHVTGLDFSAAEAFARLRRVLSEKGVSMVLSGISMSGHLGQSLAMVGLFNEDEEDELDHPPRVFEDLNKALEACENDQLIAFKARSEALTSVSIAPMPAPGQSTSYAASNPLDVTFNSPRAALLQRVATATIESDDVAAPPKWSGISQPLLLILQTFRNLSDKDIDFWYRASQYFTRVIVPQGHVLYSAGDEPNGFYLLEEGILRAEYELEQGSYQESIVAGTTCGELPFFAGVERSATVVAERECVAWLLSRESWEKLGREWMQGEIELLKVGLKLTAERMSAVTSYVLVTAS